MLMVLEVHAHDTERALKNVRRHYEAAHTVKDMVTDHIDMRIRANGYTVRRYKGILQNHIGPTLGDMTVDDVDYRDIVRWVKGLQSSGLASKSIANAHGLLSASFESAVLERKRADNLCQGVALPRDGSTEEAVSFLTHDEWEALQAYLEDHRPLFMFLAATGVRFGEATALYARDFTMTADGQTLVAIERAWSRDEQNRPVIGPPKTS